MTTTAPPPEAEALATAPKVIVISQFDVLLGDIKEAKERSAEAVFDYSTKAGNREARSYVFAQRKLKGRIELARTDAKSYALAYGRRVDEQAAELKDQVEALIKPHQDALDAITQAEADRVARHRLVVDGILDLARVPFGISATDLAARLESAKSVDIDGLEEFKQDAAAYLLETIRTLEAAHAKALADEAAAAELAQLREQQRIQKEKEAEEARLKAQQEAIAEAARKAQEEADAAALQAIQEAEQKVADAEARAAAAEAKAADAEAVADLLQSEALLAITPAEVPEPPAIEISDESVAGVSAVVQGLARSMLTHEVFIPTATEAEATAANADAEHKLRCELAASLAGRTRLGVVDALIAGTLHPAITIDWSKV
jgi:colicin import membrane protein